VELLVPWKSNKYCIFLCVYALARAYLCVGGCPVAWACACACLRVALLIQHSTHMRHNVLPFVASLAPPRFSTFSYKLYDFRKKVIEHKIGVLIFSTTLQHFSFKEEFSVIFEILSCRRG
jgi:hypothetical protein